MHHGRLGDFLNGQGKFSLYLSSTLILSCLFFSFASRFETRLSLRWLFAFLALSAFIFGSRRPYLVFDVARAVLWVIVIFRIGNRYFGRSLWLGEDLN